jgi:hypothetical protein
MYLPPIILWNVPPVLMVVVTRPILVPHRVIFLLHPGNHVVDSRRMTMAKNGTITISHLMMQVASKPSLGTQLTKS